MNKNRLNLILKFTVVGDPEVRVAGAARLSFPGDGRVSFIDAVSGAAETLNIGDLQSFSIQSIIGPMRDEMSYTCTA